MSKKINLLGAHMSIAGGVDQALYRGASIGCNTIQIFTHSNRQWHLKPINENDIENFLLAKEKTGIASVVSHASYLINLGSESSDVLKKSLETLEQELIRCDELGISDLVLHPGSGKDPEKCLEQIADNINKVFDKKNSKARLCLELMSGMGNSVCYTFERIAQLISLIHKKSRLGVCFDTCHAWAAGYDFSTPEKYKKMWHHFDATIGLNYLKVFHLNDSKKGLGSKLDRHENIGQGLMGLESFRLLINDRRFLELPKILETPDKEPSAYEKNLKILNGLRETYDYA